jgi:uncharacterized membrane protein YgdD (TMEM256/DUF423 family)
VTPTRTVAVGAACGALAVVLGAFGAHALEERLSAERLAVFETGVRYHFVHALALLATGLFAERRRASRALAFAAGAFVAGIALFSGSLYALSLLDARWLGAVAPFGGVAFIAGWAALAAAALARDEARTAA